MRRIFFFNSRAFPRGLTVGTGLGCGHPASLSNAWIFCLDILSTNHGFNSIRKDLIRLLAALKQATATFLPDAQFTICLSYLVISGTACWIGASCHCQSPAPKSAGLFRSFWAGETRRPLCACFWFMYLHLAYL